MADLLVRFASENDAVIAVLQGNFGQAPTIGCGLTASCKMISGFKVNMPSNEKTPRAFWICATITAISATVSASFSVAGLLGVDIHDRFAQYAASRSIAILLVVLIFLGFRSGIGIAAMALTMSLVQLFDAVIGVLMRDSGKTYGPLFLALIGFVSVAFLLRGSERSEPQNRF
jgi:hypothetical protein